MTDTSEPKTDEARAPDSSEPALDEPSDGADSSEATDSSEEVTTRPDDVPSPDDRDTPAPLVPAEPADAAAEQAAAAATPASATHPNPDASDDADAIAAAAAKKKRKKSKKKAAAKTKDPATKKVGLMPGTLAIPDNADPTVINSVVYSEADLRETRNIKASALPDASDGRVVWLDVNGLGTVEKLEAIANKYGIHPLAMEDVVTTGQRPKYEPYPNHLFIIVRLFDEDLETHGEQIALVVGRGFVISFQERFDDCFDGVRKRLRTARGRIRHSGADYLGYALVDAVVDHHFLHGEGREQLLLDLEERVMLGKESDVVPELIRLRRTFQNMRRYLLSLRAALEALHQHEETWISAEVRVYLRDVVDHTARLVDEAESQRDQIVTLMDVHLAVASQNMNEVMRLLTVVTSIFIPLSFLVGLYGMNFDYDLSRYNMPELHWKYGYPALWAVMLSISGALLLFFYRRGWLSGQDFKRPQDD